LKRNSTPLATFRHTGYFRLFLLALVAEAAHAAAAIFIPSFRRAGASTRPPLTKVAMEVELGIVLLTVVIGGILIVHNPQLLNQPPLIGIEIEGKKSPPSVPHQPAWPAWQPIAICIAILFTGLFIVFSI
jgi:hypothetical protein